MESGFDTLKVKVRENLAWVALGGEVPSLTIPFQLLNKYYMEMCIVHYIAYNLLLKNIISIRIFILSYGK